MKITIKSGDPAKHACDLLFGSVFGAALKGRALELDAALGGLAGRCLTQGDLGTSAGATLLLPIAEGLKASRALLFSAVMTALWKGCRKDSPRPLAPPARSREIPGVPAQRRHRSGL